MYSQNKSVLVSTIFLLCVYFSVTIDIPDDQKPLTYNTNISFADIGDLSCYCRVLVNKQNNNPSPPTFKESWNLKMEYNRFFHEDIHIVQTMQSLPSLKIFDLSSSDLSKNKDDQEDNSNIKEEKNPFKYVHFTYPNNTLCICSITKPVFNSGQCNTLWFFLYTGVIAAVILAVQITCIYYVRKKNADLPDQKPSLRSMTNENDRVRTMSIEDTKFKLLDEDMQNQQRIKPPLNSNLANKRDSSNIYYSLDNLHIAAQGHEPLNSTTLHRPLKPLPEENLWSEKTKMAAELNAVLNKKKIFNNNVINRNSSNTDKRSVQKVLPIVKSKPVFPDAPKPALPPQFAEIFPPLQKPATVFHVSLGRINKPRAPSPSIYGTRENSSSIYNDTDEDWTYEELSDYPIYNT